MGEKSSYAVKLSSEVKKRLKEFCKEHGLKQGYFVEQAIKEKIEQMEDLEDIAEFERYKHLEVQARNLKEYLKKRKA
ncbi:MAG TPA: hypothetical protein EYP60_07200 [bacterium (Candidatus Stahlbacteria)]|nr:hypothetical protein [Candidatus Stahlbacteria bacterium]